MMLTVLAPSVEIRVPRDVDERTVDRVLEDLATLEDELTECTRRWLDGHGLAEASVIISQ